MADAPRTAAARAPSPPRAPARSARDTVAAYFERHLQTLVASLGRLARAPFGTLLTVGVIGVALALPACLHLFVVNARALSGGWDSSLDFTVYLEPSVPDTQARQLAAQIGERPEVESARLVTAKEGLAQFREWSGLGTAIDALKENPLPASIVVRPRIAPDARDLQPVQRLGSELGELPGVDQVQLDAEWIRRFEALVDALRRAVTIAAAVLAVAVLMIVGNTIRLDIEGRRAEIEVAKLVGASDGFVRRPFLYGGFWYGLAGGFVAWALAVLVVAALAGPAARIAAAYGSSFQLAGLDGGASLTLLGGGALLGWLGAWLSATRHLKSIEPGHDG
jgi:cell division transport system permease protein